MKKLLLITLTLILCFAANGMAYEFTLKYATHTAANDDFDRLVTQPLFADIARATDGRVRIESHFSESLLKHDVMWDGLAEGRADIGLVISSFFYDRTPLSNVMDLPTLPQSGSAAEHAGAMWRMYEKFPEMQAEYLAQGLRPLIFHSIGQEYLFTSKPVAKLEDLRGIRLVSDSPLVVKQFNFFDTADIYQAQLYEIFNMTAEEAFGFIAPADTVVIWNLAQSVPYVTQAPLSTTYIVIAVSEKQWQALPVAVKEQVMDACGEAGSRKYSTAYADYFAAQLRKVNSGLTFIDLTPEERQRWVDLNQPLVDEWLAEAETFGLREVAEDIYKDLQKAIP